MIQNCLCKIGKYVKSSQTFLFLLGLLLGYSISRFIQHVILDKNNSSPDLVDSFSEDTGPKNSSHLLFVGVMTAQKFLDTRSYAIFETWGQDIFPHFKIFGSENATSNKSMPLVRLKGVDDSYPPQKKSFSMLKYMYQYQLENYRWFMRADDDIYIKIDKLQSLLRSINSSRPYFIGQAGQGTPEELGTLALQYNENFCMGGPGVLISQEALRRVGPYLDTCLQDLKSTHEDVEVGRCIRRYAGVSCTWSYEMQLVLYHNSSGNAAYTGKLKDKFVHNAVTLHPVKQFEHMYRVRQYVLVTLKMLVCVEIREHLFQSLKILDLMYERVQCHRDLNFIDGQTEQKPKVSSSWVLQHGNSSIIGVEPTIRQYAPGDPTNIPTWAFVSKSYYSHKNSNPKVKIEGSLKEGFDDVIREVMQMTNAYSQERGRMTEFKEFLYGYLRVDPLNGVTYYLDLLLLYKKYRGHKMTINVRKHAYYQQTFSNLEIREVVEEDKDKSFRIGSKDNSLDFIKQVIQSVNVFQSEIGMAQKLNVPEKVEMIYMIIPLAGRHETLQRFLKHAKETLVGRDEHVTLMFVLFGSDDDQECSSNLILLDKYRLEFPTLHIKIIRSTGIFSRSLALNLGASQCQSTDLLFFIDIDVLFSWPALHRLRLNTKRLSQVYYPVVFSEFSPQSVYGSPKLDYHFVIDKANGYWRQFGYGITSMFKSEFDALGGFDQSIQGWGKEDVDLYNRFLKLDNITIFRAPEPGLVHVYHEIICDPELSPKQLQMCVGTKSSSFASTRYLTAKILQKPEILEFARKRRTTG